MIRRTLEEGTLMETQLNTKSVFLQLSATERKRHDRFLLDKGRETIATIGDASIVCSAGVQSEPSGTKVRKQMPVQMPVQIPVQMPL